jgi:hypothetical protein
MISRRVEPLAAHLTYNQEVSGSSHDPASIPVSARVASIAEYAGEPVTFVLTSPPSLPAIATVAGIFFTPAIGALAPSMAGATLVALVLPACWLTAVVMPFTGAGIAPRRFSAIDDGHNPCGCVGDSPLALA